MLRALASGITGLKGQEVRLDVIGNNIANANTIGYRASRVGFADLFSQTLSNGAAATATLGAQNPVQVGLGVQVAGSDIYTNSGSLEHTGQQTDLAVQGDGFEILRDGGGGLLYTRAGHFGWDDQGYLVNPGTGQRVQGWTAASNGSFGARNLGTLDDIRITTGRMAAQATSQITLGSNLDAGAAVGTTYSTSATVFDSQGQAWTVALNFTKVGTNVWDWAATDPVGGGYIGSGPDVTGSSFAPADGQINFDADGNPTGASTDGTAAFTPAGAQTVNLTLHFGTMTQLAAVNGSTATVTGQDGMPGGVATGVGIDGSGVVSQLFSNGSRQVVAQIGLGSFPNPAGLLRAGNTNFALSNAAGLVQVGPPGTGAQGSLYAGVVEQSNVDLSREFTDLIVTQRAFQANTRVISAADEILQDLVNLRR